MADKQEIKALIEEYRDLERAVAKVMTAECRDQCVACRKKCCRVEVCVETLDSPWLEWARWRKSGGPKKFDEKNGWLTEDGCGLQTGRPPVCYGFFCNYLLLPQTLDRQFALTTAGRLIDFAGRRALGQRRLIEMEKEDFERMKAPRLHRRIEICRQILDECEKVLAGEPLDARRLRMMRNVVPLPKELKERV